MSSLMNYLLKKFDAQIESVMPYDHQTLLAEYGVSLCPYSY